MRRLVVGDIHGAFKALKQVLERASFKPEEDCLISLGDVSDGWPDVKECFDFIAGLPNRLFIIGNHDDWLREWARGEHPGDIWTSQGGAATQKSYGNDPANVPAPVLAMLNEAGFLMHDTLRDAVFVHGGIQPERPLNLQKRQYCMWDRNLITWACRKHLAKPDFKYGGYKEIYVGHSSTTFWNQERPIRACNVIAMDTGGGWDGKLSVMDIDTKEVWQSDTVADLYPGVDHGKYAKQGRFMYFEEF